MSETGSPKSAIVFTIGHSKHPLQGFLDLLNRHQIEVLMDIRSSPYSEFASQFNSKSLKVSVEATGIQYLFFGRELGGRPEQPEFYDGDGHVLYGRVAESPLFRSGIAQLLRDIPNQRIALLCSEENPANCHRRLLVGKVLAERGICVHHIRGDGRIQSEEELLRDEQSKDSPQPSLFEFERVPEWRSTQSVLPKRQRSSFSER